MSPPPPAGPRDRSADPVDAHGREQDARVHARVLQWAAGLCLMLLTLAFALYAAGIAPGLVPGGQLPAHWQQSSAHWRALMVQTAAGDAAFSGIRLVAGGGDLLCLMAMLGLCLASLPALVVLLARLLRRRDWPLAAFAALNIGVMALALVAALA